MSKVSAAAVRLADKVARYVTTNAGWSNDGLEALIRSKLENAYRAGRKSGLEDAAKVAESFKCSELQSAKNVRPLVESLAAAIRALKEKP